MPSTDAASSLVIGLNAVLAAFGEEAPHVLCVTRTGGPGLPFGAFDPQRHRTFELGLRDFVQKQTAVPLGYVEQLYTFGDQGREAPRPSMKHQRASERIISVGYLALAPAMADTPMATAEWHDWYAYFPWEDWRSGTPYCLKDYILPQLNRWAALEDQDARRARIRAAFGTDDVGWEEERALDRYELMYEAGLVAEAVRDGWDSAATAPTEEQSGRMMISDHRRILATAIGRLRGKLRYRPIIFEMMEETFTLTDLQSAVEMTLGFPIHKQNFRRSLESAGLVDKVEGKTTRTGGRPAAVYRSSRLAAEKHAPGLTLPRLREVG